MHIAAGMQESERYQVRKGDGACSNIGIQNAKQHVKQQKLLKIAGRTLISMNCKGRGGNGEQSGGLRAGRAHGGQRPAPSKKHARCKLRQPSRRRLRKHHHFELLLLRVAGAVLGALLLPGGGQGF